TKSVSWQHHLFAHGEYIKGITSLIKYKLKK
ncbi:glycosyltransferase family 8 C-terminal domain-containing protein, partial [Escherichia coli]